MFARVVAGGEVEGRRTSEAGELALALADDDQVENLDVRGHDAAADGLALALTLPALAVARGALLEQKADALRRHHTLLHRETLLVVATRDLEDVPLELVADDIAEHLLVHAFVVELAPEHMYTGHRASPTRLVMNGRASGTAHAGVVERESLDLACVHKRETDRYLQLALILDLDDLLATSGRVRDVELHKTRTTETNKPVTTCALSLYSHVVPAHGHGTGTTCKLRRAYTLSRSWNEVPE